MQHSDSRNGKEVFLSPDPDLELSVELTKLVERDRLQGSRLGPIPCFAHDDHRFVLPLAHFAQSKGWLPSPCKVVMFDFHHDSLAPRTALDAIKDARREGVTAASLLELTDHLLGSEDDDWLRAGMELGIFSSAVVFGVKDGLGENLTAFNDHMGDRHEIWLNGSLPGSCFDHQGNLCDWARSYAVEPLWTLLDWQVDASGCSFDPTAEKVLFSIDLDAFAMDWEDFTFPWEDEVWQKRFHAESNYGPATGWSGKKFVDALLDRTGLLTIAREPKYCGGEDKMRQVFADLNTHVFDGRLSDLLDGAERASAQTVRLDEVATLLDVTVEEAERRSKAKVFPKALGLSEGEAYWDRSEIEEFAKDSFSRRQLDGFSRGTRKKPL